MRTGVPRTLATLAGVIVVGGSLMAVGGDESAVQFTFASARRGDVAATASASGNVETGTTRELAFGTSGIVTKLNVSVGQKVHAGEVLATLDSTQASEDVTAAQASLAAANAKYDQATASPTPSPTPSRKKTCSGRTPAATPSKTPTRRATRTPTPSPGPTRATASPTPTKTRTATSAPKPSCATGTGSGGGSARPSASPTQAKAVTEAQASASVVKAQVSLDQARRELAGTTLTAPIDGTVLSVSGVVGSKVSGPGSSGFVTLGDLDELQVQADFSQSDVAKLKVGQSAKITLPAGNGGPYDGTVAHIEPQATTSGSMVQYGVMISFDGTPKNLLIGQSATVQVTTSEADNALQVPAAALRTSGDGTYTVLVKHGAGLRTRVVRIGLRSDSYVQIVSGLKDGDKVKL